MKIPSLAFTRNMISLTGTFMATICGVFFLFFFLADLVVGFESNPYLGIFGYLILPSLLVLGLILIPVGMWLETRLRAKRLAAGQPADRPFMVLDFNEPRTRIMALLFVAATAVNLVIVGTAGIKGLEVMDSVHFCGQTCHSVMDPEFTAYSRSPHARVKCVECHIGSGASWFVKSKLSGSRQLFAVAFNTFQKPIPTPVHNLRPARQTCEQCHWPARFAGDRVKVFRHFDEDEKNTEKTTALMLHIGGTKGGEDFKGIHWHVDPKNTVRFFTDEKRETVGEIVLERADGTKKIFKADGVGPKSDDPKGQWRTMDCVDCHNRPTHIYRSAVEEVESALVDGRIDASLPFIRREALKALNQNYPDYPTATAKIKESLTSFYSKLTPTPSAESMKAVQTAADVLANAFSQNVFPNMNLYWGTYKSNLGHEDMPGCFRCHDEQHKTEKGETISMDCAQCHKIIVQDEKSPAILDQLGLKRK